MAIRHDCQCLTPFGIDSPAARRPGRAGFWAVVRLAFVIIIGFFGLIVVANSIFHWDRGTHLSVTDKEEIYYKNVSKEEAESLGQALKEIGYFTGGSAKSVQLDKKGNLYVLNFVVKDGFWDKEDFVDGMRAIALQISSRAFEGQPVELRLSDQKLNLKKSLTLDKDSLGKRLAVSDKEEIYYRDVKEEQAKKLGEFLQKVKYFDGKSGGTVTVGREGDKLRILFVVAEGKWDDDRFVREMLANSKRIRQDIFSNQPMEMSFADVNIKTKKTVPVE